MLLIDDILLFPMRGIMFCLRGIHKAIQEELENEADSIRIDLSELYMMLETERITEEEFDARERELLDRLEEIELRATVANDDEGESLEDDEIEMGNRDE
jgi:hypothetical protein